MRDIDFARASIPYETLSRLEVRMEHFLGAFSEVEPSAVREVLVEVPNVAWSDIGGLYDVKARLVEALEWPLKHADLFERARVRPPKGILLAGPPGVGKTMLARAAATQCQANFISVKGPELMGRFVGESESALREVFRKARQASPCVIFFDEIDALLPRRGAGGADSGVPERVLGQFLAEMDGVEDLRGVLVLGATNRLDVMDPAALRPGRFDRVIELGTPDEEARAEIFRVHLTGRPLAPGLKLPALCADLAARTPGASGAQISGACQRAALRAVARAVEAREALRDADSSAPRITADDLSECVRELLDRAP
jgi:transitional endoplasmic reticulum ATPase